MNDVVQADCLAFLATIPTSSVDSCVTDPPYELGFMGKAWDKTGIANSVAMWSEVLRVLKPGAHLLAFSATRTYHRMVCAIEDAGFEIRDQMAFMYGTGFPKSLNVSKAIDKAAGAENIIGIKPDRWTGKGNTLNFSTDRPQRECKVTAPATAAAKQWDGWGTALKPAWEPIVLARKPLSGTVAANVLEHGCGALNVDGCRIETDDALGGGDQSSKVKTKPDGWDRPWMQDEAAKAAHADRVNANVAKAEALGRWPANIIHDGSEEVVAAFPESSSGANPARRGSEKFRNTYSEFKGQEKCNPARGADSGSAARFFYSAKAAGDERGSVWTCNCEATTVKPWQKQDQGPNAQTDSPSPSKDICGSSTREGKRSRTSSRGKKQMDPSQTGMSFITETKTSRTTDSKTSNSSMTPSTSESTEDANYEEEFGGSPAECAASSSQSIKSTGISPLKDGPSTEDADHATSQRSSKTNVCERCGAEKKLVSHSTVKPLALMRYLVRLVTPPGGVVLDHFAGSGSTLIAAKQEGMNFLGCDKEAGHVAIAIDRLSRELL